MLCPALSFSVTVTGSPRAAAKCRSTGGKAALSGGNLRNVKLVALTGSAWFAVSGTAGQIQSPKKNGANGRRFFWLSPTGSARRQLLPQEGVGQTGHERRLLVVRGTAVTTFNVLVIEHLTVVFTEHFCRHLACMARMDTVITC